MSATSARRALIVKFGAIGDVLMVIPAAHALHLQGYAIDWVCGQVVAPVLACYPWINTIVADDRALLKGGLMERIRAIASLWRQIRSHSYELCATLYYDRRYQLLTLPVRAKRKIVLSRTERATRLTTARHHSDEYARILLGLEDDCRPLSIKPCPPERLPVSPLAARRSTVRIGLIPGGASNMLRQQTLRRWPVTEYKTLAQKLIARGYEVVLLGGPDDAWVRPTFEGLEVVDAIGKLTLPEVIASFNTCDVVISHDTGPLHLAGLSTAGLVGLFGPTDPGNFLPRRDGVRGIWGGEGFACRPCYDGKDFPLCSNNGCMQQIKVDLVLFHIDALLRERESSLVRPVMVVLPSGVERESR
jgi:heptosyltransferase-2